MQTTDEVSLHDWIMSRHQFRWGGVDGEDCLCFPASRIMCRIGVDPAAEFRGTYKDREGAYAILSEFGGEFKLMERQLSIVNAKRVQVPQDDDIGLVRAIGANDDGSRGSDTLVGAIRFGPQWAFITPAGVKVMRAEHVAAWRVF